MTKKAKLAVFLLLSSLCHQTETPFRNKNECPGYKDELQYCVDKSIQCINETMETVDCHAMQCKCLREVEITEPACKNFIDGLCLYPQDQEDMVVTTSTVIERLDLRMKGFDIPRKRLTKFCFEESAYNKRIEAITSSMTNTNDVLTQKIVPAFVITQFMMKPNDSTNCAKSIEGMKTAMEEFDSETFSTMPFSFDQSHCGWVLGDFTRIILRAVISETIPNFMRDFNHCCAIERDCYISGTNQSDCGKRLEICTKMILKKLKRGKSKAMTVRNILLNISAWTNRLISENNTHYQTESFYVTYSRKTERWFDRSRNFDNPNKTAVYLLELNNEYEEDEKKKLIYAYKVCKFNRNEISSCLYSFIYCKGTEVSNAQCTSDIEHCYSRIKSVNKKCSDAIGDVKSALGPPSFFQPFQKITWTMFFQSLMEYFYLTVIFWVLQKFISYLCKRARNRYNQYRGVLNS